MDEQPSPGSDPPVPALSRTIYSLLKWFGIALVAFIPFLFLGQLIEIQLRLSRNGAVVDRLKEAFHVRFPKGAIAGGTSYEREVIYVGINDHVDKTVREDIEEWMRQQKIEQKIAPTIYLRFSDDPDDFSSKF
jgi:hypothetical protein